jgi:ribose transport system permease protein
MATQTSIGAQARTLPRRIATSTGGGTLVFLLVMSAIMATQNSKFLTSNNLFNVLNQSVFIGILAVAMTIVLIHGGIDLSVGAVAGLTGGVVAYLMGHGVPMGWAFIDALMLGTALGIVNGLVITRLGVPDFIATLAMLGVARGLLFVWTQGVPFIDYATDTYRTIGGLKDLFWQITLPMIILLVVALAAATMLTRSRFGSHVRATGSNREGARLSGVAVDKVKIAVYALSGALAALVGILLAGRLTTVQPGMGEGLELRAIAAAILGGAALTGGRGSVVGAVVGAVTLAVIQNIINLSGFNPAWETLIVGVIILAAVLADRLITLAASRSTATTSTPAADTGSGPAMAGT